MRFRFSNFLRLVAIMAAVSGLAIYTIELIDFMTHSWNRALYENASIPDCNSDTLRSSCYTAFKYKYLLNLTIAEYCLIGLFVELIIIRIWRRKPLAVVFGKAVTLLFFVLAASILFVHGIARIVVASMAASWAMTNGFGLLLGLYVIVFVPLLVLQCILFAVSNFPAVDAKDQDAKMPVPRLVFLFASGLILLVYAKMGLPIDNYGLLIWGFLTSSAAAEILQQAEFRPDRLA